MSSKYQPQLSMWREDLYKGIYSRTQRLTSNKKLRFFNQNYCEFSRRSSAMGYGGYVMRILMGGGVLVCFFISLFLCYDIVSVSIHPEISNDLELQLLSFSALIIFSAFFFFFTTLLNYSIFAPKDCPIRLNRQTGKVYIYDYILLNLSTKGLFTSPFFRVTRPVQKEFDWQDIQAVMTSMAAPISTGGMVRSYVIRCVVCKPGTTEMIDHFCLTADSWLSYDEWIWINSYMAFSDSNLDMTTFEKDNVLGRAIEWCAEYDEKSKVSSIEEYNNILLKNHS